jgi:hypothetical protein
MGSICRDRGGQIDTYLPPFLSVFVTSVGCIYAISSRAKQKFGRHRFGLTGWQPIDLGGGTAGFGSSVTSGQIDLRCCLSLQGLSRLLDAHSPVEASET